MDDVHCTHRATRVAEDPLGRIGIQRDRGICVCVREVGNDVFDYATRVVGRGGNGRSRKLV
jgi:hypothetical protein